MEDCRRSRKITWMGDIDSQSSSSSSPSQRGGGNLSGSRRGSDSRLYPGLRNRFSLEGDDANHSSQMMISEEAREESSNEEGMEDMLG